MRVEQEELRRDDGVYDRQWFRPAPFGEGRCQSEEDNEGPLERSSNNINNNTIYHVKRSTRDEDGSYSSVT